MELGGGGSSSSACYFSSYVRAAAAAAAAEGCSRASGRAAAGGEAEAGADPSTAAPSWRKGLSESAPPRALGRRSLNAFVPCTNLKILLERDLSKERHELLKDQRLFRNRARKHSIETNKRRRALEEKWKEDEEKEQKFREHILLQRKLKHQEATEKFQRGHISSSQRKRGAQRKPENILNEAFQKSQVPGLSSSRAIGSVTVTNSSAIKNGPLHWKQSSVKPICDRITQENSRVNQENDQLVFQQNLDEMQQQLQEQHFSNLQDFHQEVSEIANSRSVCSMDSLEAGEPAPTKISSLSKLESSVQNLEGSTTRNKHLSAETDGTFSKNQHVNNWLLNLNPSNIQTTSPFHDILIKYNVVPSNEDPRPSVPTSPEQGETERRASNDYLTFLQSKTEDKGFLLKHPSSGIISTGDPLVADKSVLKLNKARAIPDTSLAVPVQDNFELSHNRTASAQIFGTSVAFPYQKWNVASHYSNGFILNCMKKGKEIHAARCTEDIDYVAGAKDEKYSDHDNVEIATSEEHYKGNIDQHKGSGEGREAEIMSPLPQGDATTSLPELDQQKNDNATERKVMKLPKSILKKESKYELSCFKAVVVNRGIRFGHQPVASARDSVELAKIKGKDGEIQKNCKKLRWFDEINRVVEAKDDEKVSEQSTGIIEIPQAQFQAPGSQIKATASKTNIKIIPSCTLNSVFPENHSENSQTSGKHATAGGSERDTTIRGAFVSKGCHVAKQAWMATRSEELIPFIYNYEPKTPKANPRKSRTKMIKRPKSAKVPSSTVMIKNRKGAIIRPQSASETTKVMRTQGKVMVPHPPCKPIQGKRPDENLAEDMCQSANLSKPADAENSHSDRNLLPESQHLGRGYIEDPSVSNSSCLSQLTTMRPSYSIFTYEPLTKATCIANTVPSVAQSNSNSKRSPMFSENGLCPDRTPTDEEITVLWQGVHRALAQKDGAAGDSQHYASFYNNSSHGDLQHAKANVSHITIDGGNLMSNMKSGVRVNPIYSSHPNAHLAFARRKQINENSENKRKALLEQRRQMSSSAGRKPTSAGQNTSHAMMQAHSQYVCEPVRVTGSIGNDDEDSTTQFLIAENLVNLSATESEILTGLDTAQPYRQAAIQNRPSRQGMSSLSFEEHKVLQSLDRINQRLQNVHETINKNPSSTSILQTIPPLATSPSYVDVMPPLQRYRSILDATHSLKQRRY